MPPAYRPIELPAPATLERVMQSLAMLDAILEDDWSLRYFSFDAHWSPGERMGSMRDGQGNDLFALFDAAGCFVRGFDHEAVMSPWGTTPSRVWPGVLDQVPAPFAASLNEPSFHMQDTTFCLWRAAGADRWSRGEIAYPPGDDPDGAAWILSFYEDDPACYQAFATGYYEFDVPLDAIARVYRHEPLSPALVQALGSRRPYDAVAADAAEIGYPPA